MYFEMRLRNFCCPDCHKPFKSTSPNAVRCPKCSTEWSKRRNRDYQRRRYAAKRNGRVPDALGGPQAESCSWVEAAARTG
jgi:tRNA(Ile2) C34 agmatinyltransferase TiaS